MTKRKLTQQQQRRVAQKQSKLLDGPQQAGLVLAHHGKHLEVENHNGQIIACNKRQNLGPIVPGDRVLWQMEANGQDGVVVAIEPRHSLLSRPDARGTLHAVAANVDKMFIIIAPSPTPAATTIDRYLVAAQHQKIAPILVLNKEDLLVKDTKQTELLELLNIYSLLNIPTLIISAKQKQHLAMLHEQLAKKTSVFVGQSGVGKSSILANLLPDQKIKTGDLSTLDKHRQHGKHTTTTARLYHVPELAANIIDSPGIREFPLWKMDAATLARGFAEFRSFIQDCKFRNCTHVNELGCALLAAASAGKIARQRLHSYHKILADMPKCEH